MSKRINSDLLLIAEEEKAKRAAELVIANVEKANREAELVIANKEKTNRAAELVIANADKAERAAELVIANKEKANRSAELVIANIEKAKRSAELVIANVEKTKRSAELVIANKELVYQKSEKAKRAAELLIANVEKSKHAAELVIANIEKAKRAAQFIVMNKELKLAKEKEKLAAELTIVNKELSLQITERRQAQAEIKLQNKELQKINAEKDKFFSIIAHDLKGPFNGFLGLTQVMAEELPGLTAAEIQKIAVSMRNSANNLYHLLENLLEWSQIQKGAFPFNPEVIQLGAVVVSSINLIHESAKRKNIEIATDIADGLLAFADKNMFQTIIRNLVFNAIKFTPKGGKVNILAKTTTDNNIEISITDNGIGMSQSMVENLFRIDVQTNRKGTEDEPSTGLGLLLCKEFTEKNGGKIRVESEEANLSAGSAGGSTFYFTLPVYTAPESESINRIEKQ